MKCHSHRLAGRDWPDQFCTVSNAKVQWGTNTAPEHAADDKFVPDWGSTCSPNHDRWNEANDCDCCGGRAGMSVH